MKKRNALGFVMVVACLFLLNANQVLAAKTPDNSLLKFPGIKIVNNKTKQVVENSQVLAIPGDYSNSLRLSDEVFYSFSGTDKDAYYNKEYAQKSGALTVEFDKAKMSETPSPASSVRLSNITVFQGQYVDLRINFGYKNGDNTKTGKIKLYVPSYKSSKDKIKKNFLRFDNGSGGKGTELYFEYEYLKAGTEERVQNYKGLWNFKRINAYKGVSVDLENSHQMYVYDDSDIIYEFATSTLVKANGTKGSESTNTQFTNLFDAVDGSFRTTMTTLDSSTSYLKYELEPITKMELPYPEILGFDNDDSDSREVKYRVIQDMPEQADTSFYPNSYILTIQFDKEVDVKSADYHIKDVDGNDRTSEFSLINKDAVNNQMLFFLTNTQLKSSNMIDNSYRIDITANLKSSFEKTKQNYYDAKEGYYKIPASVTYTTNDNVSPLNNGVARLKSGIYAEAITQTVNQGMNTSDWKNKSLKDLFKSSYGAFTGDNLTIQSIENKTFTKMGKDTVSVTLKGTKSGITRTFVVPVTVLEKKEEAKATIHFVDEAGKEVRAIVEKAGYQKDAYDFTSEQIKIENYNFLKIDDVKGSQIKGTFPAGQSNIDIYLVYQKKKINITINYVDEKAEIINSKTVNQTLAGENYSIQPLKIPGYKIVKAKVGNDEIKVAINQKVTVPVKETPISVNLIYEPIHYSLKLSVDKENILQGEILKYSLKVISGMTYAESEADNYKNVKITIPINSNIESIKNVTVLNSKNEAVGRSTYDKKLNSLSIELTEAVKNTEDLFVNFEAIVKNAAKQNDIIYEQASMSADFMVNKISKTIYQESEKVASTISGGLRIVSAPSMIDFGEIKYLAKKQRVDNPTITGKLEVADTREGSKDWDLLVSVEVPLKDGDELLPSKLRYKTADDDLVLTSEAKLVYENTKEQTNVVISEDWGTTPESEGIKLEFDSTDKVKKGNYTGKIRWTVVDGK